jgi:hypothetical protein
MTAIPSRRRRRTILMLSTTLVAVLAAGTLGVVGVIAIRDYTAATDVSNDLPIQRLPITPVGLFATVDSADRLTSATVFVLAPSGRLGGSIISVPVNADITGGVGDERISLQATYASGGADALLTGVESALSLTVDQVVVASPGEAGGMLLPVGPIEVDLPVDVRNTDGDRTTTILAAGTRTLTAAQAVRVLTSRAADDTEAQRQPNIEAVWAGVAAAIGSGVAGLTQPAAIGTFGDLLTTLMSGPVGVRGLTAVTVAPDDNPTGIDVAGIDGAEVALVFGSIAPASRSAAGPWLTFRIEAPPGYDEKVQLTISVLMFFGGNVVSVDLAAPRQAATELTVLNERIKDQLSTTNDFFGDITVLPPSSLIEGIDVTIRLGTDYLDNPALPLKPTPAPVDTVPVETVPVDTVPATTG